MPHKANFSRMAVSLWRLACPSHSANLSASAASMNMMRRRCLSTLGSRYLYCLIPWSLWAIATLQILLTTEEATFWILRTRARARAKTPSTRIRNSRRNSRPSHKHLQACRQHHQSRLVHYWSGKPRMMSVSSAVISSMTKDRKCYSFCLRATTRRFSTSNSSRYSTKKLTD